MGQRVVSDFDIVADQREAVALSTWAQRTGSWATAWDALTCNKRRRVRIDTNWVNQESDDTREINTLAVKEAFRSQPAPGR